MRVGYVPNADGTKQFSLCGSCLPASEGAESQWQTFVTIKTVGYEPYLGGTAYGDRPATVWITDDLSASLQSRPAE